MFRQLLRLSLLGAVLFCASPMSRAEAQEKPAATKKEKKPAAPKSKSKSSKKTKEPSNEGTATESGTATEPTTSTGSSDAVKQPSDTEPASTKTAKPLPKDPEPVVSPVVKKESTPSSKSGLVLSWGNAPNNTEKSSGVRLSWKKKAAAKPAEESSKAAALDKLPISLPFGLKKKK
jgi:hypothetical protein